MTFILPEIGLGCANLLDVTLPDFIDIAEAAGFHRITVRPYAFAQAIEAGWSESRLRSRLDEAGIAVTMIDGHITAIPGAPRVGDLDPAMQARLPPDVLDPPDEATCFRAATALGAPILNVTHYLGPSLPLHEVAAAVSAVCRRAAPHGLTICLEFFPDSGLPDLPFTQSVVAACAEPNATILLDVFHLDRSGGTVEDVRQLPPGAIAGVQLSDRTAPEPGTAHVPFTGRRLPGEGRLPLYSLVEAALAGSPGATVDLEVLNDELRALPPAERAARLAASAEAWRTSVGP